MNLNDYYLVKAFGKPEYMEDFNSGNIYLNSTSYFWKLENAFQQDKEGLVYQQSGKGFLLKAGEGFKELLKKTSSLEELLEKTEKENIGEIICETLDFSFRLEGYICCFYLLPKNNTIIKDNKLFIINETEYQDIMYFLEKYLEESNINCCYVNIYDAVKFYNVFAKEMQNKEYGLTYGVVKYKDMNEMQKIELFQKNYKSTLFIKPTRYSYQKEFRIFINTPDELTKDHIVLDKIETYKSLLYSFCCNNAREINLMTLL